ncbi:MAG: AMP-binding protein [Actinobacteria bacterium]|nr:AMP-binding protein [Actinomycetota bacterium]
MPETDESDLVAIVLPPVAAASAVREVWDAGGAAAVLDPRLPAARLAALLDRLAPTHVVDDEGRREVGGAPVEPAVSAVVATSGTTTSPRLVALTGAGLEASAVAVHRALDGRRADAGSTGEDLIGDRWLACLPLHHVAGLAILARARFTGADLVVHDGFDPAAVATAAGDCTLVSLVPTALRRLLAHDVSASARFRRVLLGGGSIPEVLLDEANAAGAVVVTTYGCTETGGGCVHDGYPLEGVEVLLGELDEILVRGAVVMAGYHRDPEATLAAIDTDGFHHTGDVGAWDAEGRLHVVDRLRDLVITGGVNVSPTAVEQALADAPGVADCCVVGAGDPEWGERVVACVVPLDPAAPPRLEELRAYGSAQGLTGTELPRELRLLGEIPRTPSGKPRRSALRDP